MAETQTLDPYAVDETQPITIAPREWFFFKQEINDQIAEAFQIMLEGGQSKGIFVNIFGGINKCDLVAQGIVDAAKIISEDGKSIPVPVVVRLEGTNVERGREILKESPIANVIMAETMEGGAEEIVRLVKQAS